MWTSLTNWLAVMHMYLVVPDAATMLKFLTFFHTTFPLSLKIALTRRNWETEEAVHCSCHPYSSCSFCPLQETNLQEETRRTWVLPGGAVWKCWTQCQIQTRTQRNTSGKTGQGKQDRCSGRGMIRNMFYCVVKIYAIHVERLTRCLTVLFFDGGLYDSLW